MFLNVSLLEIFWQLLKSADTSEVESLPHMSILLSNDRSPPRLWPRLLQFRLQKPANSRGSAGREDGAELDRGWREKGRGRRAAVSAVPFYATVSVAVLPGAAVSVGRSPRDPVPVCVVTPFAGAVPRGAAAREVATTACGNG